MQKTDLSSVINGLITDIFKRELPLSLELWDGSSLVSPNSICTIKVNSPDAFKRLLFSPGELGLARAYVSGDLEIKGSIFDLLELRNLLENSLGQIDFDFNLSTKLKIIQALIKLKVIGLPPKPPQTEIKPTSRMIKVLHSKTRDKEDISYHYDVSNEFYELILGESMVYSCGYFGNDYNRNTEISLEQAQLEKCDLICRKLQLNKGQRLLDVGCGWGTLLIYAALNFGVTGVGITLSQEQYEYATMRIKTLHLEDRVEIRLLDYRDLKDETFDAISSVGMSEHVGKSELKNYFKKLNSLLKDDGKLLNHAISRPFDDGKRHGLTGKDSFINRYVFPDGELEEVGYVVTSMQNSGFEVRDVESLRDHYAKTLRHWVSNLENNYEDAVQVVGHQRARIWRLYMAGSAVTFEDNKVSIHQVLAVKTPKSGHSNFPLSRLKYLLNLSHTKPDMNLLS